MYHVRQLHLQGQKVQRHQGRILCHRTIASVYVLFALLIGLHFYGFSVHVVVAMVYDVYAHVAQSELFCL